MKLERERTLELLKQMVLIRRFEEKSAEMYSAGKIRGFLHLYVGEEAVAVGVLGALGSSDNIVTSYREHGHALVRGTPPGAVMAEMFGKSNGCSRGRGGSMHLFDVGRRFFGGHAIVGGGLPIAVGLALADQRLERPGVTAVFFGDGAMDEGEFHESMNLAALWKLPVLFVCENNLYAMGTALARHQSVTDLCVKPSAYGVPAESVDGMDLVKVLEASQRLVGEIRESRTARFLELKTYRFRAHSMYDAELYRSKDEVRQWQEKHDPIDRFKAWMGQQELLQDGDEQRIEDEVAGIVARAVEEAEAGSFEPVERLTADVYTENPR